MAARGRFETLPWLAAQFPTCGLAQVSPADLDIPILGQLALAKLPLGDAFGRTAQSASILSGEPPEHANSRVSSEEHGRSPDAAAFGTPDP